MKVPHPKVSLMLQLKWFVHIRDVSKAEKKNKIHLNEFESEKGEESVEHMLWSEQPKSESIRTHTQFTLRRWECIFTEVSQKVMCARARSRKEYMRIERRYIRVSVSLVFRPFASWESKRVNIFVYFQIWLKLYVVLGRKRLFTFSMFRISRI